MITRLERLFDKLQEEKRITFEEFTDFCPRDGVAEAEIREEEDKRYYNSGVYCSRTLSTCTTMAPPYSVYDNDVAWLATIGGGP